MDLPTSLERLKKLLKEENRTTGRLASLNTSRDLSLQTSQAKLKKSYTPNLNVVRNKEKAKLSAVKSENKRKRSHDRPSHNSQNKRPRYLQTEGIFSQGISEVKRQPQMSERATVSRDKEDTLRSSAMSRASRSNKRVSATVPNIKLSDFVIPNNEDSESDREYDPIVLPLSRNKDNFISTCKIRPTDTKADVKLKTTNQSPTASILTEYVCTPEANAAEIKQESTAQCSFKGRTKIYDEENPCISIIKLPSTLRGQLLMAKKGRGGPIDVEDEGPIGSVRIRKSGKMEVVIRNTAYVLEKTDASDIVEDVVLLPGKDSISLEPSVVTLSSVHESYVLGLNWGELFSEAKRSARRYYW